MRVDYNGYWKKKVLVHDERFWRDRWNKIVQLVEPYSTVLDVGCGDGIVGGELVSKGCNVYGIDVSEVALIKAGERGIKTKPVDLSQGILPYEDAFFDTVILSCVLEHLPNPEKILKESSRILKENGYALVVVPNVAYIKHRLELLMGHFPTQATIDNREHLSFWNYSNEFENNTLSEITDLQVSNKFPCLKDTRGYSGKMRKFLADFYPNLFASHSFFVLKKLSNYHEVVEKKEKEPDSSWQELVKLNSERIIGNGLE